MTYLCWFPLSDKKKSIAFIKTRDIVIYTCITLYQVSVVNWNNNQPIFQQIKQRVEQQILLGTWGEGSALPSVRSVASDLKINHLTVMKAYQLLVDDKLIEKQRGRGMFVLSGAINKLKKNKTTQFLNEGIPQIMENLEMLNIPVDDFISELKKQIKESK